LTFSANLQNIILLLPYFILGFVVAAFFVVVVVVVDLKQCLQTDLVQVF